MAESITGLTTREVEERRARGEGETGAQGVTKSTGAILRENICTLFNALNFAIAILLFLVGAYSNMLFIAIIILNIVIGIVQELKAKKLVDELTILNQPHATVLRDGCEIDVETREIVKDDVIVLESGRQICNDAVVLSGELEVNESLLTGESDSVDKKPGDQLLSGSSVISGRCHARVIHVGDANYANSLINEVRQSKRIHSELLDSMRKVTRFTSFLIIPLGVLLFAEAFFGRHAGTYDAVVSSAAALLGMLPKGLVLLISVSLPTALSKAAPFAVVVTAEIVVTSLMVPFAPAENTTVMYLMLIAVSMIAVIKSCIPFTWIRAFVSVTMAIGTPLALVILPRLFEVAAMTKPMTSYLVMAMICALIALAGYFALVRGLRGGDEEPGAE